MKIAVAILNYNGKKWLEKFLPEVMEHSKEADIYVIDNASTDDSVLYLNEKFPSVKQVLNGNNYGFAGGYNLGLQNIEADYYILLNSDIEVTQNWINPVIQILEADSNAVAAQPKILAYHNKTHFEHAGAAGGYMDKYAYPFCRGRIFEHTEPDSGQYNDNREVFWATGACLFIRANKFHEFSGFDADYFAHMEEIDLCWRMKNAGYTIHYCGESTVYHVGGGTLDYNNPRKVYLNFRNSLFTLYKNIDKNVFGKIFIRLVLDGVAGTKFLLSGKPRLMFQIIKAHFNFYAKLSTLRKKRAKIKHQSYSKMTGYYPKSIVWKKFIRKNKTFTELE